MVAEAEAEAKKAVRHPPAHVPGWHAHTESKRRPTDRETETETETDSRINYFVCYRCVSGRTSWLRLMLPRTYSNSSFSHRVITVATMLRGEQHQHQEEEEEEEEEEASSGRTV